MYDEPLSKFAFKLNLRRYNLGARHQHHGHRVGAGGEGAGGVGAGGVVRGERNK